MDTQYQRFLALKITSALSAGKSVLLLGPRQVGKTTLIKSNIAFDLEYTFLDPNIRQSFEGDLNRLKNEILGFKALHADIDLPTVYIDEVQRVPSILDSIQYLIDTKVAKFILTGSSARKLKQHKHDINLLPGRLLAYHLDALSLLELKQPFPAIEDLLLNGLLPEITLQSCIEDKETLLQSYVSLYLEQEVRAEALVRDLASFSQFLRLAAIESGDPINFSNISQDLGVSRNTVYEYFRVLEDCLIIERIDPLTEHTGRRRLSKASKYLFFDLGVRRVAASEGLQLPQKYYGSLFEQFVGMEVLKLIRLYASQAKLKYWHDHNGPEVDFVIEYSRQYFPIEVKWTEKPTIQDARHLLKFMQEYDCMMPALIVCRTPRPLRLHDHVLAISWQDLATYLKRYFFESK